MFDVDNLEKRIEKLEEAILDLTNENAKMKALLENIIAALI
jgi:hypothetical protein